MNFVEFLKLNWQDLLALTREHIFLVVVSTGIAILIGVPTGILLTRIKPRRAHRSWLTVTPGYAPAELGLVAQIVAAYPKTAHLVEVG